MSGELAAILLVGAVHVAAFCVLIWAMLDADRGELRGWWPRDEGPDAPEEPGPGPGPPGRSLPLPDALPAAVRLRGPGRLTERAARHRGDHEPQPARTLEPV